MPMRRPFLLATGCLFQLNTFLSFHINKTSHLLLTEQRKLCHFLTRPSCKCRVMQKFRNSTVVYHKTKNPFGTKICMNSSFQLLLYITKM